MFKELKYSIRIPAYSTVIYLAAIITDYNILNIQSSTRFQVVVVVNKVE